MIVPQPQHKAPKKEPPAPLVKPTGPDTYTVLSRRSGNTYTAHIQAGRIVCSCPSRGACYHLAAIATAHTLNLIRNASDSDRVLVSEISGLKWHTVVGVKGDFIFTLEVPSGFRLAFVVGHERDLAQERRAVFEQMRLKEIERASA